MNATDYSRCGVYLSMYKNTGKNWWCIFIVSITVYMQSVLWSAFLSDGKRASDKHPSRHGQLEDPDTDNQSVQQCWNSRQWLAFQLQWQTKGLLCLDCFSFPVIVVNKQLYSGLYRSVSRDKVFNNSTALMSGQFFIHQCQYMFCIFKQPSLYSCVDFATAAGWSAPNSCSHFFTLPGIQTYPEASVSQHVQKSI